MPDLATIRAAIVATLNSVTDIGQVHGYERYAKRQSDFRALYETTGQIRGWRIRRARRREKSPALGRYLVEHDWDIRGYLSLDDSAASEPAFDAVVEAIVDAFRTDDTLGGVVHTMIVNNQAGIQVQDSGPVMFAGVLCHSARLALTTLHAQ